jgi:hypothetical protein
VTEPATAFEEAAIDLIGTLGVALVKTGLAIKTDSVANEERAKEAWRAVGENVVELIQQRKDAPWQTK